MLHTTSVLSLYNKVLPLVVVIPIHTTPPIVNSLCYLSIFSIQCVLANRWLHSPVYYAWSHCTILSQSLSTVSVHSALLIGGVFVNFFCCPKDLSHLVKVVAPIDPFCIIQGLSEASRWTRERIWKTADDDNSQGQLDKKL